MSAAAKQDSSASYVYWRNALAGNFGPVHDSEPHSGFWRKRVSRGGGFVPVAIWQHEGRFIALVDGRQEADAAEIWTFVCRYPITEEVYHARVRGEPWPDEDSAVTASLAPPSAGHNNPPMDEAETLAAQIEAARANAKDYENISDDATAAKAQSARSRLNELSREADRRREHLKKPHLEAGKSIDAKWNPLVKAAKAAADAIQRALSSHETRKAREAAEAARKVAEADAARHRAMQEALAKHPEAPPEYVAAVTAPPATPVEAPKAQIRGSYGKAAAVKVVRVSRVTDYEIAVPFFATNPDVRALVDKLAQRTVDAGIVPPGVEVTEERKVA